MQTVESMQSKTIVIRFLAHTFYDLASVEMFFKLRAPRSWNATGPALP